MYKKIVWPILIIITVALAIAFIGGFMKSINITSEQEEKDLVKIDPLESMTEDNGNIRENVDEYDKITILVVGDSIGAGVGDERGLGIGNGYSELIKEASNNETELVNLAVPGAVVSDLLEVVGEEESINRIEMADTILVSIGGNDLNHLLDFEVTSIGMEYEEILGGHLNEFKEVLDKIRKNNDRAIISVLGLYNPYGDEISEEKRQMLFEWNHQTELLVYSYDYCIYIPVYDLFVNNLDEYLAPDDFHPNAAGYDAMTKRIYAVLKYKR